MWDLIKGTTPVLLIASHAYSQIRSGNLKLGDIGTGQIARKLAKSTKCWALVSTKIQKDPNWYTDSPFRKKIDSILKKENIKVVFDIHGRKDSGNLMEYYPNEYFYREYGKLLSTEIVAGFRDNDQITIVEHLEKLNIPGLEIEINKDGRAGKYNQDVRNKLKTIITEVGGE
ncbi:MAG TPA: hypothetical protein VI819_01505 [Patescibacteria group bacterium]|nr:hypothetical protein [Patescibacteria group bacterium]